jgi:hypothetical protein
MEQERRSKFVHIIKADTSLTRLIKALSKQLEMLIQTGRTDVNALLLTIYKENVLTEEEYTEIVSGHSEVSYTISSTSVTHTNRISRQRVLWRT